MSFAAPQTPQEAKTQYCNYGYDKSKYTSTENCIKNYVVPPTNAQHNVSYKGAIIGLLVLCVIGVILYRN